MEPTTREDKALRNKQAHEFKASDVREAAGLSYRQLNDWDAKGAVPGQREGGTGWRKFSAREVFALMVCSEIRKQFGVPVESLRFVRSFMLQENANHLAAAVRMMSLGLNVWLLTDLRETFVMDSDVEFEDLLNMGFFRVEEPSGYLFLRLNPLVNRLLATLKKPMQFETRDDTYEQIRKARSTFRAQSHGELKLLGLLRNRDYKRVTVELRDGEIVSASTEEEIGGPGRTVSEDELLAIIRSQAFQTVTLKKHDGKTVRVQQTIPFPMKQAHNAKPKKAATASPRPNTDRRGGKRATKTT